METDQKSILIGTASVIAIFAFLTVVYFFTNKPVKTNFPEVNKVATTDHTKWSKDNKILLVEYSDFQCPGCKYFHSQILGLEKDKDFQKVMSKITFVYRDYPLPMHAHAQVAAQAAEAAGKQGKFYEMGDKLFDQQETWGASQDPKELFTTYAKELGLNLEQFNKDYDAKEVKDKITSDVQSGNAAEIPGTPTFFLNGKRLDDIKSLDEFKKVLQDAIK